MSSTWKNISIGGTMITTTITNNPTIIDSNIEELKRIANPIIGLDVIVESKPADINRASLIQLCNGSTSLIIQLSHLPYVPASLKSFLSQPNVTFVDQIGLTRAQANEEALRELKRDFESGLRITRFRSYREGWDSALLPVVGDPRRVHPYVIDREEGFDPGVYPELPS
ncbi:hypothetical protein QJS10_CPB22g00945 [Acorus calamus]|uniref:Uncharacterized protein n=1 Tax=Acorus calamus TaxID=4465 RepID=A0AAV9C049_ACOCL|nr:hypothetical protein QJS10_CPB22g00945 [Acorus calamus]